MYSFCVENLVEKIGSQNGTHWWKPDYSERPVGSHGHVMQVHNKKDECTTVCIHTGLKHLAIRYAPRLAYPHKVFQFCIKVSSAASAIGSCFQLWIHKNWGSWADSLIETMLTSMQWSPQGVDLTKSTVGILQSDLSLCELRCLWYIQHLGGNPDSFYWGRDSIINPPSDREILFSEMILGLTRRA